MYKIYCFLIITSLGTLRTSFAQGIDWSKTSNWKLYNIHNQAGFRYTLDTLQNFASIDLNKDTLQSFLKDAVSWPPEKYSMWMGLYVATCETEDKKLRKIIISTYGGFFYEPATKRYYQVASDLSDQWLEFINDCSKRIKVLN